MTSRNLPPVVTLAAGIAFTACSGEEESGRGTPTPDASATATAPPPSSPKQKYARDANEIRAAVRERLDQVPRPTALDQIPAAAALEIEIRQQAISQLAALDPPPELEDAAAAAYEREAAQARKLGLTECTNI